MSVGRYLQRLDEALEQVGASIPVLQVESWKDEPAFIEGVSERIASALQGFPHEERDDVYILFTACLPRRQVIGRHCLPLQVLVEPAEDVAQPLDAVLRLARA